jgi:hypothetical protein
MAHQIDIHTDADGWSAIVGARYVGPDEHLAYAEDVLRAAPFGCNLTAGVVARAFAAAADPGGVVLRYDPVTLVAGPVSDALREEDAADWRLAYDRFTAMTMLDVTMYLLECGLLANRGNGDSVDYRLALPESTA